MTLVSLHRRFLVSIWQFDFCHFISESDILKSKIYFFIALFYFLRPKFSGCIFCKAAFPMGNMLFSAAFGTILTGIQAQIDT